MGPWFIRDASNPFRPGCNFQTLRALVERGRVVGETVIRGPTTGQFWRAAAGVPGVANVLGACHACRAKTSPGDRMCGACGASFDVPEDRQQLGIGPVRLLPGEAPAQAVASAAMGTGASATRAESAPIAVEVRASGEIRVEPEPAPAERSSPAGARSTLSAEQKAARLRRIEQVEAEARMLLSERRAREQGRVRIVGAAIGLLLLLIAAAALLMLPQIMGSGGAGGGGGGGNGAGRSVGGVNAPSNTPGASNP